MKIISTVAVQPDRIVTIENARENTSFQVVERIAYSNKEVEVLVTFSGKEITPEILALMPNLRWVAALVAGIDKMPLEALAERGIALTNARGVHRIPIAEHVIWTVLTMLRQGKTFIRQQDLKVWNGQHQIELLEGKTVCIVGAGSIGTALAEKCQAFGAKTIGVSRSCRSHPAFNEMGNLASLREYLGRSDIVILLLPHTLETEGLFNAERLSWFKDGSYLINVARGSLTDEQHLIENLRGGKIRAAALDVFNQEPLTTDSPLWDLDNVLVTPHIAGSFPGYFSDALDIFVENLKLYPNFTEMKNNIDYNKGY